MAVLMHSRNLFAVPALLLLLSMCTPPAYDPPPPQLTAGALSDAYGTATAAANSTETRPLTPVVPAQPSDTPTPPFAVNEAVYIQQNTLPPMGDPDVLAAYYKPSPRVVYGYLTRYLDNERAVDIAMWQLEHFREQAARMSIMLGGGYAPDARHDGEAAVPNGQYFNSVDGTMVPSPDHIMELTPAQVRLYRLSQLSDEDARAVLTKRYDYVIALKTPNDIGRVFCVYQSWHNDQPLIARVFVGDTSAVNDYTGFGGTDGLPLGYRVTADPEGRDTHWLADVPGELFDKLLYGDNAWAIFTEDVYDTGCTMQPTIPQ